MQKQTTHLTLLLFRRIAHPYLKRAMTIRPGIKCRMWSRSVPPEAGRISLRSVQADPGQRVVTGTSQAIIIYTNGSDSNPIRMIRATSCAQKTTTSDPDPNRLWEIRSGKSEPARFRLPAGRNGPNRPDRQRIRHVYCEYIIYIFSFSFASKLGGIWPNNVHGTRRGTQVYMLFKPTSRSSRHSWSYIMGVLQTIIPNANYTTKQVR